MTKPKPLDQLRHATRVRQYSAATEQGLRRNCTSKTWNRGWGTPNPRSCFNESLVNLLRASTGSSCFAVASHPLTHKNPNNAIVRMSTAVAYGRPYWQYSFVVLALTMALFSNLRKQSTFCKAWFLLWPYFTRLYFAGVLRESVMHSCAKVATGVPVSG